MTVLVTVSNLTAFRQFGNSNTTSSKVLTKDNKNNHSDLTHQSVVGVQRPNAGFKPSLEELSQILVMPEVLYGCLLHVASEHPDVDGQQRLARPLGQV